MSSSQWEEVFKSPSLTLELLLTYLVLYVAKEFSRLNHATCTFTYTCTGDGEMV